MLITAACTQSDPGEPGWKALSYNVFYEQRDFSAVLEVIEDVDADVVCLQELTHDFSDQFVTRLGRKYGHRRFEARNGTHGIGVASHHSLSGVVLFRLEPLQMPALRSVISKGRDRLVIVCVHLWPWIARREPDEGLFEHARENARIRVEQVRALIRRLESEKLPVLLLGDFNESRSFPAMRLLRNARFTMACDASASKCRGSFPANSWWPTVLQVDHVLGRGLTFHSATVIERGSSDHYPITAGFEVSSNGAYDSTATPAAH